MSRIYVTFLPDPNSCRWCGIDYQGHYQRWHPDASWHGWTEPTNEQRLTRMRARRARRQAAQSAPEVIGHGNRREPRSVRGRRGI